MCEHRFCSQTKTRGDRNCTACFSLANIFNQSTNKRFGAKLQSEVTDGFTQVRIGNLINQSATSCAISIPLCSKTVLSKKTFKDVARRCGFSSFTQANRVNTRPGNTKLFHLKEPTFSTLYPICHRNRIN